MTEDLFNKKWLGKEPILRLIHTLVDNDKFKHAYLWHFNLPLDRMVIENTTLQKVVLRVVGQ